MSFQRVPVDWPDWRGAVRRFANSINDLGQGRSNAIGEVTLTASQTTTVVTDARVGTDSVISMMPTTANAAAESWYIGTVGKQTFTITHANNSQTDRTYTYAIQG